MSAPLLGLWADYRPAREPLFVSMILNVLFNLLYSYCGVFQSGVAGWVMLCARLVTGLAAGERGKEKMWEGKKIIISYVYVVHEKLL